MIVFNKFIQTYRQDPTRYFRFGRFQRKVGNCALVVGSISDQNLSTIKQKKILRLEFEEPNIFAVLKNDSWYKNYNSKFSTIFTICPYTANYYNKINRNSQRIPIFFPFNELDIPPSRRKKFDIIYTGHINSAEIKRNINEIKQFKYAFVSNSKNSLVTHNGAGYKEKIKLISQSKITLVHNLLFFSGKQMHNVHKLGVQNIEAFSEFDKLPNYYKFFANNAFTHHFLRNNHILVPQIKSRLFEAAFCKSLILCRKDPFNVIERFFEPNKDFIYYEAGNLNKTVENILNSYSNYEVIINNAYTKAVKNYTTTAFVTKYLSRFS